MFSPPVLRDQTRYMVWGLIGGLRSECSKQLKLDVVKREFFGIIPLPTKYNL